MVLYVIPNPAPPSPAPLMIVLDYLYGNPTFMANFIYAGQHAAAGEVLAFPAHLGSSWNNGLSGGESQGDLDFLTDVIADATNNLPVDSSNISMTGFSEGGFMADLFACTKPNLLIGFGMVSATQLQTTACETGTRLKMMIIDGTKDNQVPYNGIGTLQPAPLTLSQWETTDGCSGMEAATTLPPMVNDGTTVVRHQIPGCPALIYQIVNGGHAWPGSQITLSTLLFGISSQNIDATAVQWSFFTGP